MSLDVRAERIARLALTLAQQDPSPVPPIGGETVVLFHFDVTTPTQVLQALPAGSAVNRAVVLVETPFNDPAATLRLGITGNLNAFISPADVTLSRAAQYQSDALVVINAVDMLIFTPSFGAATTGDGYLLYKLLM
jgi:hypothetical protein